MLTKDKIYKAFTQFDDDKGGTLSVKELNNFLCPRKKIDDATWKEVLLMKPGDKLEEKDITVHEF